MTSTAPGREAARPPPAPGDRPDAGLFAVVAAHRVGQPLHGELLAIGAQFVGSARTAPTYRMIALPGPGVSRGGIVRVPTGGAGVEVELHLLPAGAVDVLARALPEPLVIGQVEIAGAPAVAGIVCAAAPPGSVDVTEHGSWPAYLAAAVHQ